MTVDFTPYFSTALTLTFAAIALALAAFGLYRRMRGAWLRATALALIVLALANPSIVSENREPLSTIVAIVADRSQSQLLPGRQQQTDAALADLKARLAKFPGIEPRIIDLRDDGQSEAPSTKAFAALSSALSDVAPSRIGGAVFITRRANSRYSRSW